MLLGKIHSELVQHLPGVALQCAKQRTTTVNHNKAKFTVIGEQGCQCLLGKCLKRTDNENVKQHKWTIEGERSSERPHLGVELVVAEVQGGVNWLKRLKVDIDFLLLPFFCHNGATVHNQTIRWHWKYTKVRG